MPYASVVVRTRNIFDFASKELTVTALWAWVLDAEQCDDTALRAVNADLRLKLKIPSDAVLVTIELEKNPDDPGLKPLTPSDSPESNDRKRIDILATYRLSDGSLLRYVIENKVRRDSGAIEQVIGYRDRLQKRVTGAVCAAIFTFDNSLSGSAFARESSVIVLTLSDMVAMISSHAEPSTILGDYSHFLRDKLTVASASPVRGLDDQYPENLARWSVVARKNGTADLLSGYEASATRHGFAVRHAKGRSIFLTIVNRSPVVSVHPSKSSAAEGLWFGVSITNLTRAHDMQITRADMPTSFAWQLEMQSGNEWRFGYLSAEQIEPTLRMIAEAASRRTA